MKPNLRSRPGIDQLGEQTSCSAGSAEAVTAAWERLYLTQRHGLIKALRGYIDAHEAENIVQDAFLRLWKRPPLWLDTDGAPAGLMVTARRLCLSYLRRATRLVVIEPECLDRLSGHPEVNGTDRQEQLAALLKTLPPQQAQVVRWHCDGMCLRDIALRQWVPLGTVKWRLHAAKSRMREFLNNNPNLSNGSCVIGM
jgi:RNA polymerase sigma-70 factor, ECF subfamily